VSHTGPKFSPDAFFSQFPPASVVGQAVNQRLVHRNPFARFARDGWRPAARCRVDQRSIDCFNDAADGVGFTGIVDVFAPGGPIIYLCPIIPAEEGGQQKHRTVAYTGSIVAPVIHDPTGPGKSGHHNLLGRLNKRDRNCLGFALLKSGGGEGIHLIDFQSITCNLKKFPVQGEGAGSRGRNAYLSVPWGRSIAQAMANVLGAALSSENLL